MSLSSDSYKKYVAANHAYYNVPYGNQGTYTLVNSYEVGSEHTRPYKKEANKKYNFPLQQNNSNDKNFIEINFSITLVSRYVVMHWGNIFDGVQGQTSNTFTSNTNTYKNNANTITALISNINYYYPTYSVDFVTNYYLLLDINFFPIIKYKE